MPIRTLATDYDGTIATHGTVDPDTLHTLRRLRDAGGTLMLVTGRELPQLKQVFPELPLFHIVVAENGALLYWPETGKERPLCDPPEESFVRALKDRGVKPLSVGRVIVATYEPHETVVLQTIRDLGLERQVIFNKGGVGAAVANALPSLKEHADLVLSKTHGAGVSELIERILDGSIDATPRRPRAQSKRETARVHRLADKHADVHPN